MARSVRLHGSTERRLQFLRAERVLERLADAVEIPHSADTALLLAVIREALQDYFFGEPIWQEDAARYLAGNPHYDLLGLDHAFVQRCLHEAEAVPAARAEELLELRYRAEAAAGAAVVDAPDRAPRQRRPGRSGGVPEAAINAGVASRAPRRRVLVLPA